MNTAFSGPQLADVIEREKPEALVYDEEFSGLLEKASEAGKAIGLSRYVAWSEDKDESEKEDTTLAELIESNSDEDLDPPEESGRFVILTSGTTGTPKGAQRAQPDTLSPLASLFSQDPSARPREDDDRGAALPFLGLRPFRARAGARTRPMSCAASSTRRRR